MDLSKFNDFFGLFAALNLAYAGSESFRDIVDMDILKLYDLEKKKAEAAQKLLDALNVLKPSNETSIFEAQVLLERIQSNLKLEADKFKSKYDKNFRALNIHRIRHGKYTDGYKSMFLITSLFCTTMILIAGFDSDISNETLNLLFILELCLVFNTLIFIRSFINRFCFKKI